MTNDQRRTNSGARRTINKLFTIHNSQFTIHNFFRFPSVSTLPIHVISLLPLAWLLFDYWNNNLTVNPIQEATIRTGKYALIWLLLSLACTPANTLFGWRVALKLRRPLGLYAFMYAFMHVFIFVAIDYALDWDLLFSEVALKPYIVVGFTAFTILSLLALTLFQWWMKRLGKNWKRLHRLVYIAAVLVIVHYAWAAKGDVLQLSGDTLQPFAFGLAVALLLLARVPPARRWLSRLRLRSHVSSHGRESDI